MDLVYEKLIIYKDKGLLSSLFYFSKKNKTNDFNSKTLTVNKLGLFCVGRLIRDQLHTIVPNIDT